MPQRSTNLPAPIRALTDPIDRRELLVKLEDTLALWRLPDDWPKVAKFYVEALADVPADLVDETLKHARLTSKWLPKPSELREPIAERIKTRSRIRGNYSSLPPPSQRKPAEPPPPAYTDADREVIAEAMRQVRQYAAPAEMRAQSVAQVDSEGANRRRALLRAAADEWRAKLEPKQSPAAVPNEEVA